MEVDPTPEVSSESDYSEADLPPKEGAATENTYNLEENCFRKGVRIVFDTLKDKLTPPPPPQADEFDKRYESDEELSTQDKSKSQYLYLPLADRMRWDLDRSLRLYRKATDRKMSTRSKGRATTSPVGVFPNLTELSLPRPIAYK